MRGARVLFAAVLLTVAVTLQMSALPHLAIAGVTCDLVLLAVVACGLERGPEFGSVAGFAGGLLLDVVPPADHAAGRWALALALAGYLAGTLRRDAPVGLWTVAATVVAGSTLSLTIFTLTGALVRDPSVDWDQFPSRLVVAAGYDLVVGALVVPLLLWILHRVEPAPVRRGVLR